MSAHSRLTPWVMWVLAVLFYCYQFVIRVATGSMREPLTLEFNLTAGDYGVLASCWLVSYALLQIPVGLALDKWGVRKVFSVSAFICGIGTLIMAQTESFMWLCVARLLIGAGSAAGFLGTFKVSSEWFASNMLPVLVGIISGIGVLGASLAGAPMVMLQDAIGWRAIFYMLSVTAFSLSILYGIGLRDKKIPLNLSANEVKNQLFHIIAEPQIWLLGTVGFLLYTPISVLADLWGPSFMQCVYQYTNIQSAFAMSFVFYGNAIGSFCTGWLFLKFSTNKQFFATFCLLSLIIMSTVVWMQLPGFWMVCFALFGVGCMVGAENLVFPLSARYAAPGYQGLAASVINFLVMVGAIALQPGIGIVMDSLWEGATENGFKVYGVFEYRIGLSTLLVSLTIGLILSLTIKGETKVSKR